MSKSNTDLEHSSTSGSSSSVPNDFLTPWLLLLLRNWSMHGYQILQTLTIFGLVAFDPSTVYRTLRRLENDGLIMSAWEMGDSGPAKRVYSLTEAGEAFLKTWASTLEQYQNVLNKFFEVYMEHSDQGGRRAGTAGKPQKQTVVTDKPQSSTP